MFEGLGSGCLRIIAGVGQERYEIREAFRPLLVDVGTDFVIGGIG